MFPLDFRALRRIGLSVSTTGTVGGRVAVEGQAAILRTGRQRRMMLRHPPGASLLILLMLFYQSAASAATSRDLVISLGANGGVHEGSHGYGDAINTYFPNQSPLCFVLRLTNLSDKLLSLGDWTNSLKMDFIHVYRSNDERAVDIRAAVRLGPEVAWTKPSPWGKGFIRPVASPSEPGMLPTHSSVRFLIYFEPERALPCNDYLLCISLTVRGVRDGAGAYLRIRQATGPDDLAKRFKMESQAFGMRGDVKKELATLKKAVKKAPESPWSWYYLGDYYTRTGDLRRARETFREGARRFPFSKESLAERVSQRMLMVEALQPNGEYRYEQICFEALLAEVDRIERALAELD